MKTSQSNIDEVRDEHKAMFLLRVVPVNICTPPPLEKKIPKNPRGGSRENLHWVQFEGEQSGSGGTPPGKFLRPYPSDWLKTLFREKVL